MNKSAIFAFSLSFCALSCSASEPTAAEMAQEYSALQQKSELLKLKVEVRKQEQELIGASGKASNEALPAMRAESASVAASGLSLLQTDGISHKQRAKLLVNGVEFYVYEGDEISPGVKLKKVRPTSVIVSRAGRDSVISMTAGATAMPQPAPLPQSMSSPGIGG